MRRPLARHLLRATVLLGGIGAAAPAARAQGASPAPLPGQARSGPVINSTGPSFVVENPTFTIPAGHVFKALFEVNAGGSDTTMNAQLITMARFYNVHVRNGVPKERLKAAAVVHGSGWTALLTDEAFAARFNGARNPSRRLTEELVAAGAQLILCGQTAGGRGIRREELLPGVLVAPSAMSALNILEADGYTLIPW
ncbi:MAG: DsrE family protein [Gemmatimonadetes bacterium]|nr:DsrE family protein [Gemmatimonadota bacterium]